MNRITHHFKQRPGDLYAAAAAAIVIAGVGFAIAHPVERSSEIPSAVPGLPDNWQQMPVNPHP